MYSAFTRAIQRRFGYRSVQRTCPDCGLIEPDLSSFPAANMLGGAAFLWATRNHRPISSGSLHCPRCGAVMTLTEELQRRKRRRGR